MKHILLKDSRDDCGDKPWNQNQNSGIGGNPDMYENDYIHHLENMDLLRQYGHSLDDYERGIASKWRLSPPDIDDAMNVGYIRDSLESYVHEFHERGLLFDDDRLSRLDAEWQKWIKKCIDEGDVGAVIYHNNDEPLQKWWMHIESLDAKDVPDDKKDV